MEQQTSQQKPSVSSCTYLVAPLPLERHFSEPNVHDVVIGLRRVTHLADDVALLHQSVAFVLKRMDGAPDSLHGALPGRIVWERTQEIIY